MRRRSTKQLLEQLRQLDPLGSHELLDQLSDGASSPPRRLGRRRYRLAFGGATALGLALALVAVASLSPGGGSSDGVIATAAAAAEEQPSQAPAAGQYAYRTENWWQASLAIELESASPDGITVVETEPSPPSREGTREIWFGVNERGRIKSDETGSWPPCSAADWTLAAAIGDSCWTDIGGPDSADQLFEAPVYIQREIEKRLSKRGELPPYSEFSGDVAKLADDPAAVAGAVEDLAAQLGRAEDRFQTLGGDDFISINKAENVGSAAQLRAAGDLLANPLSSPALRSALFEYAGSLDGVETSDDVVDPLGREGGSIAVTETARDPAPVVMADLPRALREPFGKYTEDGYVLDLGGLEYRTEIIVDPASSELLAERIDLVAADDPVIGAWLAREGAPQTIYYRAFEPTSIVGGTDERPGN